MDITESLAPTSDQLDAVDLVVTGPRTFTIESVSKGSVEQPVQVKLAEFPRVWRPSKGMRRLLAAGWGTDASKWTGHRVTLFCDPEVSYGKDKVGGVRIRAMSHLPGGKRLSVPLLITRGRSATFTVEPLPDQPASPNADDVAACTDHATLRSWWRHAELRPLITERIAELESGE